MPVSPNVISFYYNRIFLQKSSSLSSFYLLEYNKCIGDDTKAVARQSLNCIKNKKK